MKKRILSFLLNFIFLSTFCIFSQENFTKRLDLNEEIPDWQSVIGGVAMAPVLETSYGIAVLTDGRMLSACTSFGNVIWKKGINERPSHYIAQKNDFIYVVTNDKKITLVNKSGQALWSTENNFKITENPVVSEDGRIFLHGKNNVACFGINGVRKWNIGTENLADLPTCILNDGSIVVFLEKPENGRSVAKRFSQFGEEKEDLIFSSVVKTVFTCEQGILIGLENGSIGLCNVVKGVADSPWIQKSYIPSGAFAISYSEETKNSAFFFKSNGNTTVIILRASDGEFINQFSVGNFNPDTIELTKKTYSGYFIADSSNACEFTEEGMILWSAKLPSKNNWNYLYYTNSNHIIFCMKDWALCSYHTMQSPRAVYKDYWTESYADVGEDDDIEIGTPDTLRDIYKHTNISDDSRKIGFQIFSDEKLADAEKHLKNGDYGKLEFEYASGIKAELESYIAALCSPNPNQSYFAQNPVYTQKLLRMAAQIGSLEFTSDFATLLRYETDPILLSALVFSSGEQRFDIDGEILTSYEIVLRRPFVKNNENLLKNICDATYKICKYMGRPALNKHGKEILTQLNTEAYGLGVRDYARKTFEKFID